MGLLFFEKIRILVKSLEIIDNWYWIPLVYLGWVKKQKIILKTKNHLSIILRGTISDIMQFATVWLIKDYDYVGFEINDNDIILDIGGHIGLFSLYVSQKCNKGKIFCFEPVTTNYEILLENIKSNKLSNIFPHNLAVARTTNHVVLNINKDESGHSMFRIGEKSIKVKSISLKDFIIKNKIDKCDLIKLDCEGAEYEIIDSIPNDYLSKIDKFIIEYHFENEKPELVKKLIEKLKLNSYNIVKKEWSDGMGLIYAKRKQCILTLEEK